MEPFTYHILNKQIEYYEWNYYIIIHNECKLILGLKSPWTGLTQIKPI